MFAVSLTAIWCLLMPPYLYGVIGIFAAFLCGHAAGKHLPEYRSVVKISLNYGILFYWCLFLYVYRGICNPVEAFEQDGSFFQSAWNYRGTVPHNSCHCRKCDFSVCSNLYYLWSEKAAVTK